MSALTRRRSDAPAHLDAPLRGAASVHRLAGLAAAALLALAAPLGVAAPAVAHDELVSTDLVLDPTDDSLEAVDLSFNNTVMDVGTEIHVTDENGADATGGAAPEHNGTVVRQPLAADLPPGDYEVVWRVVSSDGHPIEGAFGIALRVAEDGSAADSAITEQAPGHEHEEDGGEETEAAETDAADQSASEESGSGLPVWAIALIGVGGVAVLVLVITVAIRKSRGAPWQAGNPDEGSNTGENR